MSAGNTVSTVSDYQAPAFSNGKPSECQQETRSPPSPQSPSIRSRRRRSPPSPTIMHQVNPTPLTTVYL